MKTAYPAVHHLQAPQVKDVMQREHKGHDGRQKAGAVTFVLKLAPDLVTTAPSVRTQVDCLYEVPDVGRDGALV